MVIGKRALVKHIFENQHKFTKIVRLCSSSLRMQEIEDTVPINSHHTVDEITPQDVNVSEKPFLDLHFCPTTAKEAKKNSFKFDDLSVTLAAPYQLQSKPANSEVLTFGKSFTDHMLKIAYYKQLGGWQRPEIVPFQNLTLHPAAKVLHYAVELFEGMKAYRGVDGQIRMFRPELNMKRMNITATRAGLPQFDGDEMIKCMSRLISIDQEWVPHAESASLYIRPTFIGIDPSLGVASSESALLYTILCPVGAYFKSSSGESVNSISLLADPSYTRAWPGGVGDRKMGSNYAPTVDIHTKAGKKGLNQVLWLYGDDHQLTEAGTMNIFVISIDENGDKVMTTPPLDGLILPGITRHSIIQLVENWGIKVRETTITMKQIIDLCNQNRLLELFGSGTACVVSPIGMIDYMDRQIHLPTTEQPDAVYSRVRLALEAIQYGRIDHQWGHLI